MDFISEYPSTCKKHSIKTLMELIKPLVIENYALENRHVSIIMALFGISDLIEI